MDLGLLVLHVVVGLLFVGHGSQKLFGVLGGYGLEGVGAFFETIGLRPGKLNAIAAGSAELLGGALIALGLLVPLGAALVIAVMVAATITAHRGKGIWNDKGGFELPLVNVAAVFALAAVGAGDISLDAALDLDLASTGWALAALGVGIVGALGAVLQGRLIGRGVSSGTQAQGV
jgi:putative oxidoreductase